MFDDSIIRQARNVNLPEFLMSRGEPIKQMGRDGRYGPRYRHEVHTSLIFQNSQYIWNSHQGKERRGNAVDFVQLWYGWDFKTAISELTGETYTPTNPTIPQPKQKPNPVETFNPPNEGKNINRVIAYLSKTRKIQYETIKKCLSSKILSVDENNNAVFKILDENKIIVGAEVVGTLTDKRFKQIAANTKPGYGFTLKTGKTQDKACFFESPIDLLSYYDLFQNQLTSHYLVSTAGLKESIVTATIDRYDLDFHNVWICTDADQAGRDFAERMSGTYGFNVHLPSDGFKDWNDILKKQKAASGF